jgi:hypothetical protein
MISNIDFTKILILDIETVPQYPSFDQLSDRWKKLWEKKAQTLKNEDFQTQEQLYARAGIYAEFGKIVCISVGYFHLLDHQPQFRIKSFYGHDEKELLQNFCNMLNKHYYQPNNLLCAHNGKEFDFPFIARRCVVNKIKLPEILDNSNRKPWEIRHLDTMELWKFGDYKSYTSLDLLAALFDIETPKDDIDGSKVWSVYWQENNVERIKNYCQKDVITVAQILLSFRGQKLLADSDILIID